MAWDGEERRQHPRASFLCKIVVSSPVRLLTSHTENISIGGIRVILEERLSTFTSVGLELFFDKEKPLKCRGRVVWVNERVNPLERRPVVFDTGIQFINLSDSIKQYIKELVDILENPK